MDFSDISQSDIRALVDALGSRLRPPYSAIAIKRFATGSQADSIASRLSSLEAAGFEPSQIKLLFESLLAERAGQTGITDLVDLVTTGPEAPGMTNRDTAVVVRNLFSKAQNRVLVVGYAVFQGQQVFSELARRMNENPDLEVKMCLDVRRDKDTSLESVIVKRFVNRFKASQWPEGSRLPEIYYDPRSVDENPSKRASLHAKCVVVDGKELFISSANFTNRAQHRNVEVGVRIVSEQLATQLESHFDKMIELKILTPT